MEEWRLFVEKGVYLYPKTKNLNKKKYKGTYMRKRVTLTVVVLLTTLTTFAQWRVGQDTQLDRALQYISTGQ